MKITPLIMMMLLPSSGVARAEAAPDALHLRFYQHIESGKSLKWGLTLNQDGVASLLTTSWFSKNGESKGFDPNCSPRGGRFIRKLQPELMKTVFDGSEMAYREQKALEQKLKGPKSTDRNYYYKFEIEYPAEVNATSIVDRDQPELRKFNAQLEKVLAELSSSPASAIELKSAEVEAGVLKATLINPSPEEVRLPLPDHGHEAFALVNSAGQRTPVDFKTEPGLDFKTLKKGDSIVLEFKVPTGFDLKGSTLRYFNHSILHHAPGIPEPLELDLCASVKKL
jgi:hypothetical protein